MIITMTGKGPKVGFKLPKSTALVSNRRPTVEFVLRRAELTLTRI